MSDEIFLFPIWPILASLFCLLFLFFLIQFLYSKKKLSKKRTGLIILKRKYEEDLKKLERREEKEKIEHAKELAKLKNVFSSSLFRVSEKYEKELKKVTEEIEKTLSSKKPSYQELQKDLEKLKNEIDSLQKENAKLISMMNRMSGPILHRKKEKN